MGKVQLTIWVSEEALEEALTALRAALAPLPYEHDAVQMSLPCPQKNRQLPRLTEQEKRVLAMFCRYNRVQEVAERLFVQTDTIRKHLRHIYEKLGVHSIHRAIVRAVELGLIEPFGKPIG